MNNDILLSRKILSWGWYKDANTFRVFLHLLLNANWHDGEYMGRKILRGQCVFGLKQLSLDLGLSVKNVRTALNHLKLTGEVTIKSTNKYSIATIVKYNDYQLSSYINGNQSGNLSDNQPANKGQTSGNIQFINSLNTSLSELCSDEETLKKKRCSQPVFDHESNPYKLAVYLSSMIHNNNPAAKQQSESDLQRWARDFDLMIRRDKRTAHDIYDVMAWSQQDTFWKSNILSASKLREKYDQLSVKMKQGR